MKAYLDIETDRRGNICIIGIYTDAFGFIQLKGNKITAGSISEIMGSVNTIVTFNGDNFDLPQIKKCLDLDLRSTHKSLDLLKVKRKLGIKGGLKELEKMFGIQRKTEGINGYNALELWEIYLKKGRLDALNLLLEYNREDVLNLIPLEKILLDQYRGASL